MNNYSKYLSILLLAILGFQFSSCINTEDKDDAISDNLRGRWEPVNHCHEHASIVFNATTADLLLDRYCDDTCVDLLDMTWTVEDGILTIVFDNSGAYVICGEAYSTVNIPTETMTVTENTTSINYHGVSWVKQ